MNAHGNGINLYIIDKYFLGGFVTRWNMADRAVKTLKIFFCALAAPRKRPVY